MKKRIAFLLSLIITVLCFGQSIVFADGEYNVVFLGGSITRGTGASSAENSWASLVGDYLKETMTDKTVNCFNAGSGGTGSGYGLRRLKRDVLCHNPDLVFIEFAVNDKSAGRGSIMDSVESILAALRENGNPQVIFVYSTTAKKDAAVDTYEEIAQHYGIFSINVQDYLFGLEEAGEITVNDLLTDGTHPNDAGYKMYADYIISCLKEENAFTLPQNNGVIEGNIDTNLYSYIYASEAEYTNRWETIPNNGSGPIESYLLGMNKGDRVTFTFEGNDFKLNTYGNSTGGTFEVSVDGESLGSYSIEKSSGTEKVLGFDKELEDKKHTVTVTVTGGADSAQEMEIPVIGLYYRGEAEEAVSEPVLPTEKQIVLMVGKNSMLINGEKREITGAVPEIVNDSTIVPLRCVTEMFGAQVSWVDETKSAIIKSGTVSYEFISGTKGYKKNGSIFESAAAPTIISDTFMIPLRVFAEGLGKKVKWYDNGVIVISDNEIAEQDKDALAAQF